MSRFKPKVDFLRIDKALNLSWVQLSLRVVLALLFSVVIPLIVDVVLDTTVSGINQFFIGMFIFISFSLVGMTFDILRFRRRAQQESGSEYIRNEFDVSIANIRKSFYDIVANRRIPNDFYTLYFLRAIELFEDNIFEAATRCELRVNEKHISTTDMLLACFDGRSTDIMRLVHYLNDNDFMFDVWSRGYYRRVVGMVQAKIVTGVRRLFVYSDTADLENERSKRLLDFHARQPGYDYRVISKADFEKFCRDLRVNESFADFGIYGDWYVYRTLSATSERIEGTFCSSERVVDTYIELFDNCWNHAIAPEPSSQKGPMTLYELFEGVPLPPNLVDIYDTTSITKNLKRKRGLLLSFPEDRIR